MVAVAYRGWSFARGPNCKALTGKILVFWIGGRLWEVVAYERRGRTWMFDCSHIRGTKTPCWSRDAPQLPGTPSSRVRIVVA